MLINRLPSFIFVDLIANKSNRLVFNTYQPFSRLVFEFEKHIKFHISPQNKRTLYTDYYEIKSRYT